jgi:hypothetical protein
MQKILKCIPLSTLTFAAILLGIAKESVAAQWVYIGSSTSNDLHYIDFDGIRGTGNSRTFWVRVSDSSARYYDRTLRLSKITVDCLRWQSDVREVITYRLDGSIDPLRTFQYNQVDMREIPPGTMVDAYADFICSRITTQPEPAATNSASEYLKTSCGDPLPAQGRIVTLYPVFVNYTPEDLQSITTSLCLDAFRMQRENGQFSIQVASFTDRGRAQNFAEFLTNRFGNAEVGSPSTVTIR